MERFMYSYFDPQRHLLATGETELGRWLGKEFPDIPGLFVYFHRKTGKWVIAKWMSYPKMYFEDILNLGPFLQTVNRDTIGKLRSRLCPAMTPHQISEAIRDERYRELRELDDKSILRRERKSPCKCSILVPRSTLFQAT